MTRSEPRRSATRSGWLALLVTVLARAALTMMISLLGWSLAPAALGWHPTVVMTGSMLPRLVPGDLVVSRPINPARLTIGQVVLVEDPDHQGELRLHRFVRVAPDGRLILRGDANATDDSSPVARSAVHGVAALCIPYLGRPVLWANKHQIAPLILAALTLAALLRCAFWWRPAPADESATDNNPPEGRADPEPASAGSTDPVHAPPATPPAIAAPAAGGLLARSLILGLTALALVALTPGNAAAATLSARTTNPSDTWAASTYFTCANAMKADAPAFALPLSESSGTTAADISGNATNGTYSGGLTYGVTGPCTHDSRTAVTLNGSTSKVSLSTTVTGPSVSMEIWFKATGAHGGVLFSSANNGGGQTQLALAMTSTGTLVAAVTSSTGSVTTTSTYNNNTWHLAVMTVGSAGLKLYVDTAAPLTNSTVTSVPTTNKTEQLGFGDHTALNTGSSDYFQGSIGFAGAYTTVLTPIQIAAHYNAAN